MLRTARTSAGDDERRQDANGLTIFESKLLNVLALLLVQERQQADQITLLGRAGFSPSEIAALLGTTPNTVSVSLSKLRHSKKTKRGRRPR